MGACSQEMFYCDLVYRASDLELEPVYLYLCDLLSVGVPGNLAVASNPSAARFLVLFICSDVGVLKSSRLFDLPL